MNLAETLLADFEADLSRTRKLIDALPGDKLDWKPHEKSMTLGQLAGHLAESPSWACGMTEEELDMEKLGGEWKPFEPDSKEAIVAKLEETAPSVSQVLDGKDDQHMLATWTMRKGDAVLIQEPRITAMRGVLLTHAAHHRGQLTVYLRLLGTPVPATYGPTADDPDGF